MATAYLTAMGNAFEERLVPGIKDVSIRNDPIFANIIDTSANVVKSNINDDLRIWYSYCGSLAGGIQYSTMSNPDMIFGATERVNIIDNLPSYPGLRDSVLPQTGRYSIGLSSLKGNLYIPMGAMSANRLPGAMDDRPAMFMKKNIEYMAHVQACAWYADANGQLAQIAATADMTVGAVAADNTVTMTASAGKPVIKSGRVRRLKTGLHVDCYKSDYSAKLNANSFCVVMGSIDYQNLANAIKLYFDNGDDADTFRLEANTTGNVQLVLRDSLASATTGQSKLPCGYQSWTINSGTLFGYHGDTTITNIPELMSVSATGVGDLSEMVLNQYIALYQEGVDGDMDSLFTSAGVVLNLLDAPVTNNWNAYQRQGEPQKLRMGWDGIDYAYDGRKYTIYQSPFITKGHLAGLKVSGGNLRRHYPPKIPGTGTNAGFDGAVQWIGNMFYNSIWMPTLDGNRVTEGMQAPYKLDLQMSAEDPRGMLLTGCTDDSIGA